MRIDDVFDAAGVNIGGEPVPSRRIHATCPECGHEATMDAMETAESGQQTNYVCPKCGGIVITISPAPGFGGVRIGDWVVNAPAGMSIDVPGRGDPV